MTDRQSLNRHYRMLVELASNPAHKKAWKKKWQAEADVVKGQLDELTDRIHRKAQDDMIEHVKRTRRSR